MKQHKIIGATIRPTRRTFGLAPARGWGEPETVTEVVNDYDMTIRTAAGNIYSNGDYQVMHYLKEAGQ